VLLSTSPDTYERFTAFSATHLMSLMLFVMLVVFIYAASNWLRRGERRRAISRYALAVVLAAAEIALNVWYISRGVFDPADTLPLELCSISLYLCVFMLLFRSRLLFQIVYFTGIGGALQALLTPVLAFDFPHFRFVQFFLAHSMIIIAVLYMVWVERFRPTLKSVALTMLVLNLLLVVILFVNANTGGNYMFVSHKPETASMLDFLGPYPWYLLSLEGVAVVMFLLLYLPFYVGDRRKRTSISR
jgi:hypothetical integral membrane protein (TIGR02206 family)